MKKLIYILLILSSGCKLKTPSENHQFVKIIYDLNNKTDSINFIKWKNNNLQDKKPIAKEQFLKIDSIIAGKLFYSDNEFNVYGNCNGEFGAEVLFIDKKDFENVYYIPSICAIMVEKRKDGYYITESLPHMDGYGRVVRITSPKKLIKIKKDSLLLNWREKRFLNLDKNERNKLLYSQREILIDSVGLIFNIYFNYNNSNYLVFTDFRNTYLANANNNSIKIIDTLLNKPTWGNKIPNNIINGYYHYNYSRTGGNNYHTEISLGDIYIRNDTIVIGEKYLKINESISKY